MTWISVFFALLLLLLTGYAGLILYYRKWFLRLQLFRVPAAAPAAVRFTVIIPARDEAQYIAGCVQSVLDQSYPAHLFDVIVIDDHSTDATAAIVQGLQQTHANLHLVQLAQVLQGQPLNSYKKKALEIAIGQATGDWIVTTDADCTFHPLWLKSYAAAIVQHGYVMVAAPVMFQHTGGLLSVFQCLDFMSLQGITAAAVSAGIHSMGNGANLAYRKQVFYEAEGFTGIDTIASGDDMFLMHKVNQLYPGKVGYLFAREAIVQTVPMPDWASFIHQRIRWASKADKYKEKGIFWVLLLVYLLNAGLLLFPFTALYNSWMLLAWGWLVALKSLVELCLMVPVAAFFGQQKMLNWFALMQPFHIIYTVIAGWLGKFGQYRWKGRRVK